MGGRTVLTEIPLMTPIRAQNTLMCDYDYDIKKPEDWPIITEIEHREGIGWVVTCINNDAYEGAYITNDPAELGLLIMAMTKACVARPPEVPDRWWNFYRRAMAHAYRMFKDKTPA